MGDGGAWGGGNDEGTKRRRGRCGARSCGVSGESKGPGPDEAGPSRLAAIHLLKMRQGANHNFNLRFAPKTSSSRPTRVSRPPKKNPRIFVRFRPPPASISVESRRMDFSQNGRNMNLTDTEESEYIGNGAGTPRQNRGLRRRTSCVSHLLRDESVSGNLRNFHGRASPARTRSFGRASSVSLLGFSGPPLTTAGGAFFVGPHALPPTSPRADGGRR